MNVLKTRIYQFDGKVIRNNEKYKVMDNNFLQSMTVSTTSLRGGQSTNGHAHEGIDEVYYFYECPNDSVEMIVGEERLKVGRFDLVLIPGGQFHKVINNHPQISVDFICFMQKLERDQ